MRAQGSLCLLLSTLLHVIDGLSKLNVRAPSYIERGSSAQLTCSFNLEGDALYSVKWYKGRHEFFRFMPQQSPPITLFPVKGMQINMSVSDQRRVVLDDVQPELSGLYMCEVTVDNTYFALMQYANMTVVELPVSGPVIASAREQYPVGATAHLTCSVPASSPSTKLAWFINDQPAEKEFLRRLPSRHGEHRLGLSFPVTNDHFEPNNNYRVTIKCLATLAELYWRTASITLMQERPKFASVVNDAEAIRNAVKKDNDKVKNEDNNDDKEDKEKNQDEFVRQIISSSHKTQVHLLNFVLCIVLLAPLALR